MVRVGFSHASEATTIAIWFTVSPPRTETAMMMSTSRPGTVRPISAMPRINVSVDAAVITGDEGQHGADTDAEKAGDETDLEGQRRAGDHGGEQVAALTVGAERMLPRWAAARRAPRADARVRYRR